MKNKPIVSIAILALFVVPHITYAQIDYTELTLEELLNVEITVASRTDMTSRESPGIITVITREEIERWGALDLADILRMVPGFDIELDINGLLGPSIRGIWAAEGKMLLSIDDVIINDDMYYSISLGHHFTTDMIERVEIIRGPGSAMYGGAAELGVVNITTIAPEKKREGRISGTYSRMKSGTYNWREGLNGRMGGSFFVGGREEENDVTWSVFGYKGDGNLSDRDATDWWGWSWNVGENDNSKREVTMFVNTSLQWRGLSARVIMDEYEARSEYQGYDGFHTKFRSHIFDARYDVDLTENLTVTPHAQYKEHEPWELPPYLYYGEVYRSDVVSEKKLAELLVNYDWNKHNIQGGITHQWMDGEDIFGDSSMGGANSVSYRQVELYGQGIFRTPLAVMTVGGRFEDHTVYGPSVVPRLVFTRQLGRYHLKALASRAYRSPSIMNVAITPEIEPEETDVFEIEAGALVRDNTILTMNIFDQTISNPIVYAYSDSAGMSVYSNEGKVGSRGLELILKHKAPWGDADLSYSYNTITNNGIPGHAVPGDDDRALAIPSQKIVAAVSVSPAERLYITPTAIYMSERWAITGQDLVTWAFSYEELDETVLVNLNVLYKDAFSAGLDISSGLRNLFDEKFRYVQAYTGAEGPLPGASREFYVKASYSF